MQFVDEAIFSFASGTVHVSQKSGRNSNIISTSVQDKVIHKMRQLLNPLPLFCLDKALLLLCAYRELRLTKDKSNCSTCPAAVLN